MEERLQKILSAQGICSRRAAEAYIAAGRVRVNGRPAHLGDKANTERDEITVDGALICRTKHLMYLMLNKPRGYVTTLSDEKGRKTVAELVKGCGSRVWPVGRLDLDTDGLLLLTNDGAWTNLLTHPGREVEKEYRVWVNGDTTQGAARMAALTELEDGTAICTPNVCVLSDGLLSVTIHEGKNRQVRRMCALSGLGVKRLQRVREGGLLLGDLPIGKWRILETAEVERLRTEGMPTCKKGKKGLQK